MKESVLDVLMYLFEHCFDDEAGMDSDRDDLEHELLEAGFPDAQIAKALAWLEGLAADRQRSAMGPVGVTSVRVYTDDELSRMDTECRGFMLFLEQSGVLDTDARELVIDRVMALDSDDLDLEQLKWVVLMVLFNRPDRDSSHTWMEELVFEQAGSMLH